MPPSQKLIRNNASFKAFDLSMADFIINIIIITVVVAIALIVYFVFPRVRGLHYTSRLTCPKCKQQFDYGWVPGGSFTAIRLGTERYLRCPHCHGWSTFEMLSTRVKKDKATITQET
jgi:DNA-directed RNA polymerase subunit RPC12/RpoP